MSYLDANQFNDFFNDIKLNFDDIEIEVPASESIYKDKKLKNMLKKNLTLYESFTVSTKKSEDIFHMGFKGNIYKPIGVDSKYDYAKYSNNAIYIASKWCKPEIENLAYEFNNNLQRQVVNLIKEYLFLNYSKECLIYKDKKNIFQLKYAIDTLIYEREENKKRVDELEIIKEESKKHRILFENTLNYLKKSLLISLKEKIKNQKYIDMYDRNISKCKDSKSVELLYNNILKKYEEKIKNKNDYLEPFEEQKQKYSNDFWFGFRVNSDLYKLFEYSNISYKYTEITEKDCIESKEIREKMFKILLKLCEITGSRQLLRFVNEYGKKTKTKGNDRFFDTFGTFYKYKKDKNTTIACCSYLNRLFKINSHKKAFGTIELENQKDKKNKHNKTGNENQLL